MPIYSPRVYRHDQASASDTWVIAHNLGHNGSAGVPIVDTFIDDSGTLTKIMPDGVEMTDENTVTITFTQAYAGFAIIAV